MTCRNQRFPCSITATCVYNVSVAVPLCWRSWWNCWRAQWPCRSKCWEGRASWWLDTCLRRSVNMTSTMKSLFLHVHVRVVVGWIRRVAMIGGHGITMSFTEVLKAFKTSSFIMLVELPFFYLGIMFYLPQYSCLSAVYAVASLLGTTIKV